MCDCNLTVRNGVGVARSCHNRQTCRLDLILLVRNDLAVIPIRQETPPSSVKTRVMVNDAGEDLQTSGAVG